MLRAIALAAALCALGCLDGTSSPDASVDMSMPVLDLSNPNQPLTCGISTCSGTCSACLTLGGGVCALPCMVAMPSSCTAPLMCRPLTSGSSDAGISATLVGDCAGFDGYCG